MRMNRVFVGVVLYNSSSKDVMRYLENYSGLNYTIVFYNNGKKFEVDGYRVIQSQENVGFGKGHNYLLNLARNEDYSFYVCSNLDITFVGDIIGDLIELTKDVNHLELVSPMIEEDGRYRCHNLPHLRDKIFSFLGYRHQPLRPSRGLDILPLGSGAFFVLAIDSYVALDLFDRRFFMYEEDTDLFRRLWDRKSAFIARELKVLHGYDGGSKKNFRLFLFHLSSLVRYFLKWPKDIIWRP